MVRGLSNTFWTFYIDDGQEPNFDDDKVGKWMYFFTDQYDLDRVDTLCREAVEKGIVQESKHTNFDSFGMNPNGTDNSGVCCFYLNADDIEGHKRVIEYFIKNDMIARTKTGRLYNISFKLDSQTHVGEYGSDFEGKIKLAQFVDLKTGEWIYE